MRAIDVRRVGREQVICCWEVDSWDPATLALTHFGAQEDVHAQLDAARAALHAEVELAAEHDLDGFVAAMTARIEAGVGAQAAAAILQAAPAGQSFQGLHRWRRKRAEAA